MSDILALTGKQASYLCRVGNAGPAGYAFFISIKKGAELSWPRSPKVSEAAEFGGGVRANPATALESHHVRVSKGPRSGQTWELNHLTAFLS